MALVDKETGETSYRDVIADKDEGLERVPTMKVFPN